MVIISLLTFYILKSPEIGDLCMTVLHMCCIRLTAHTFPELLITLAKKRLILWKYILLTITSTRTELILLLLIIHFYSYPVQKLKRISIQRLIPKGLLITLRLIIHLCMLHLLLIVNCRLGLMLWIRIGVRKCYHTFIRSTNLIISLFNALLFITTPKFK